MLERRWSIIQRVTDVLVNRFELSAGIHNLGRTFHVGSFKLCYNVNRALFKELRMFYGFPPSTKTQTCHVQAVTRAFSIARVSLSREQNSQTKTPDEHPSSTARGVEIFKHASRLCEARKPGKHYQVPNKFLSSDWIENLGMCVWRYCAHPKFRTLKKSVFHLFFGEKISLQEIFRCL